MKGVPESFGRATRAWLETHFESPTPIQEKGWPLLAGGAHALLVAPTGSGKTLAAFLEAIDRLGRLPDDAEPGVRVLYVSPLWRWYTTSSETFGPPWLGSQPRPSTIL